MSGATLVKLNFRPKHIHILNDFFLNILLVLPVCSKNFHWGRSCTGRPMLCPAFAQAAQVSWIRLVSFKISKKTDYFWKTRILGGYKWEGAAGVHPWRSIYMWFKFLWIWNVIKKNDFIDCLTTIYEDAIYIYYKFFWR